MDTGEGHHWAFLSIRITPTGNSNVNITSYTTENKTLNRMCPYTTGVDSLDIQTFDITFLPPGYELN